jgi:hypothetical protein
MVASKLAMIPLGGNLHRQKRVGGQAPLAGPDALFGGIGKGMASSRGSSSRRPRFEAAPRPGHSVRTEVLRRACAPWRATARPINGGQAYLRIPAIICHTT